MTKKLVSILIVYVCFFSPVVAKKKPSKPKRHSATEKVFIIPGTWSHNNSWYREGGIFYESVAASARQYGYEMGWFSWDGVLGHTAVIQAGKQLAHLLEQDPCTRFHLIGHSRGSHVGIIASQELATRKSNKRIKTFYMLGTPIDTSRYMPNMNIVTHVYNLFSFADIVQPVLGLYGRIFPPHQRIANIHTVIDHNEPDHYSLHNAVIGHWILNIHEKFSQNNIGNFEKFTFEKPALIHFFSERHPIYYIDHNQGILIARNIKELSTTLAQTKFEQVSLEQAALEQAHAETDCYDQQYVYLMHALAEEQRENLNI